MSISTEFSNAIFYNKPGQLCRSGYTPQMLGSFYNNMSQSLINQRQPIFDALSQLNSDFDDKKALSVCDGYSKWNGQETEAKKSLSKIYSFWMKVLNVFMLGTLYSCVLRDKIFGLNANKIEAEDALEELEAARVAPIIKQAKALLANVSNMLNSAKAPMVHVVWGNVASVYV